GSFLLWVSLAALVGGSANPDWAVKAALTSSEPAPLASTDILPANPAEKLTLGNPSDIGEPRVQPITIIGADTCPIAEDCIDQYLWSLYQRTKKVDTTKRLEQISSTVKKKGKIRVVTKTVTKFVVEDFTWKDLKAAENVGMSVFEYVIGGMDGNFKVR